MTTLIEQARERGDRLYDLEVIEQNPRAVRLYESVGFRKLRRLVGYELKSPNADVGASVPRRIYSRLTSTTRRKSSSSTARRTCPAPIAGMTVARYAPPPPPIASTMPTRSSPTRAPAVVLRALIVEPDYRRQGQAARLMRALFAQHPGKSWTFPEVFPEEIGGDLLAHLGFERTPN